MTLEKKSLPELKKLVQNEPENHRARALLALALKRDKKYYEAIYEFHQLQKHRPDDDFVHSNLGSLYLLTNQLAEARFHTDRAIQLNPSNEFALMTRADLFSRSRHFEQAVQALNEALAYSRNKVYPARKLFYLLKSMGQVENGATVLQKLLRDEPDNADLKSLLAEAAPNAVSGNPNRPPDDLKKNVNRMNPAQAIAYLEKMQRIPAYRDDAQIHLLLGQQYRKMRKYRDACQAYEKACQLAPESEFLAKQYGFALLKTDQNDEAITIFESFLDSGSMTSYDYWGLARAYLQKGLAEKAQALLIKAVSLFPKDQQLRQLLMKCPQSIKEKS